MGDPPEDHPGVHPPPYKPPKWDGRRKAPRDAKETRKRKEREAKQERAAAKRREQQGKKADKRAILRRLKSIPRDQRSFLSELEEWEEAGSEGPPPYPEDELPDWALRLYGLYNSWKLAADTARITDFVDSDNNTRYTGPG